MSEVDMGIPITGERADIGTPIEVQVARHPGHPLMKTKDEGTAWLRSHGWTQCEGGWRASHPSEFIAEELMARGWSADDLALRMSDGTNHDYGICRLALDFYDQCGPDEPNMHIGAITSSKLGKAFGCTPGFFVSLEDAWRASLPRVPNEGVDDE